jgi:hypothetical protein
MGVLRPFGLTDQQLDDVVRAAQRVPSTWRNRFVEAVVDRLFPRDEVTDAELGEAMRHVATRLNVNLEA